MGNRWWSCYNKIKTFLKSLDWRSPILSFILLTRKLLPVLQPTTRGRFNHFCRPFILSILFKSVFPKLNSNPPLFSCLFSHFLYLWHPPATSVFFSQLQTNVFSEVRSKSSTSAPFFTTTAPRLFCHNYASKISQTQTHSDGGQIRAKAAVYLWTQQQIGSWRSIKLWLILQSEEGLQEWAIRSQSSDATESWDEQWSCCGSSMLGILWHKRYCVNLIRFTGAQTHPFTATSLTTVGVLINPGSTRIYIGTGPSHKSGSDTCFTTVTSWFLVFLLHLKRHCCSPHSINDIPLKAHQRGITKRGCFSSRPQHLQSAFASATRSRQLPESFQFILLITVLALSMVGFWPSVWNKAQTPMRGCGSLFAGYEPLK